MVLALGGALAQPEIRVLAGQCVIKGDVRCWGSRGETLEGVTDVVSSGLCLPVEVAIPERVAVVLLCLT